MLRLQGTRATGFRGVPEMHMEQQIKGRVPEGSGLRTLRLGCVEVRTGVAVGGKKGFLQS